MTPDGIAIVWATIITPIIAIAISIWYQERKRFREAKQNVFFQAMANRKRFPPTVEWVNALNLIDVVFHNAPKVVVAWHALYAVLQTRPWNQENYEHCQLDLLKEMGDDLGYPNLKQTDIDKFYAPQAHGDQAKMQNDTQIELLRVLKHSQHFGEYREPPADNQG